MIISDKCGLSLPTRKIRNPTIPGKVTELDFIFEPTEMYALAALVNREASTVIVPTIIGFNKNVSREKVKYVRSSDGLIELTWKDPFHQMDCSVVFTVGKVRVIVGSVCNHFDFPNPLSKVKHDKV